MRKTLLLSAILLSFALLQVRAELGPSASLEFAVQKAKTQGKKTVAMFFNPGSCIKCEMMVERALKAVNEQSAKYTGMIVLEASRVVVAKKLIENAGFSFNCTRIPDDGNLRTVFQLPPSEPIWAIFSDATTAEAFGSLDGDGYVRLQNMLQSDDASVLTLDRVLSVHVAEDDNELLNRPRVNSGNERYIAVSDMKANHGFFVDRKTGAIASRIKIKKENIQPLLTKKERIFDGMLQSYFDDPIQLFHLHIINDTTASVFVIVNLVERRFSALSDDSVDAIYRIGVVGKYNTKTGAASYKRLSGLNNLAGGFSSVLRDTVLYIGMTTGYRVVEGGRSDYSNYRTIVKANINTGIVTTMLKSDSVYYEFDFRGSYEIPYVTTIGNRIFTVSSLSDEIRDVYSEQKIALSRGPFISQRELFRSLNIQKGNEVQEMNDHLSRVNSYPLKCQIEGFTSINDSLFAVAFITTEGDLRNNKSTPAYFLQVLNATTGVHVGTIRLPIDCSKREALTAMIDAGKSNAGAPSVTLVIKTPTDYRMDTFSVSTEVRNSTGSLNTVPKLNSLGSIK